MSADEPGPPPEPTNGPGDWPTAAGPTVRPGTVDPGPSGATWLDEPPISVEETKARDEQARREAKEAKQAARAEKRAAKKADRKGVPFYKRIHPAVFIAVALVVLLGVYYAILSSRDGLYPTTSVPTTSSVSADDAQLQVDLRVEQVDSAGRTMQVSMLLMPLDPAVGDSASGELSEDLRLAVNRSGVPPASFTFPATSTIDAVSTRVALDKNAARYPFDDPAAEFEVEVTNDQTGEEVPASVLVHNGTAAFDVTAGLGVGVDGGVAVEVTAERETMTIAIVVVEVLVIVLITIIAIAVVARGIARRRVDFAQVLWLTAAVIVFPALRGTMPGAPPVGTRMDYLIIFPCLVVVALGLLVTAFLSLLRTKPEGDSDKSSEATDEAEETTPDRALPAEATSSGTVGDTSSPGRPSS